MAVLKRLRAFAARLLHGATDELRKVRPRKATCEKPVEAVAERPDIEPAPGYLARPFGAIVPLISRGMTADWDAWTAEYWARADIAANTHASPYVCYAGGRPSSPTATERPPDPKPRPPPMRLAPGLS